MVQIRFDQIQTIFASRIQKIFSFFTDWDQDSVFFCTELVKDRKIYFEKCRISFRDMYDYGTVPGTWVRYVMKI
jgi:hypothetical protein